MRSCCGQDDSDRPCGGGRGGPVFYMADDDDDDDDDDSGRQEATGAARRGGYYSDRPENRNYVPFRDSRTVSYSPPTPRAAVHGQRMKHCGVSYRHLDKLCGRRDDADYECRREYRPAAVDATTGAEEAVEAVEAAVEAADDVAAADDRNKQDLEPDGCLADAVACALQSCGCAIL